MSISDQISRLQNAKASIKTSIENKGVTVPDNAKLDAFPALIDDIQAGGSGETHVNPDFYELKTQNGTNFDYLFYNVNRYGTYLYSIDVSNWDTSKVTTAQYCFANCIMHFDISKWDLSSLTDAQYMFYYFTNLKEYLDLSVLDFSNVSKVSHMFAYSNTDYLDVRNINLTGATDYEYLFYYCDGTKLDLSAWDISSVTSLDHMCYNTYFKKIDLTGWNTVNVKSMSYCFYYSSNLTTLLIPDWDMTNATSTNGFLGSNTNLKYIDLSRSNDFTIKKIASMLSTKKQTAYGEILVPADTSQEVIDTLMAKYWKPVGPKFDLTSTELELDNDTVAIGKTINISTVNNNPWYGDDRLETIEFISSDESVATINGREITGVAEGTVEIICRRRDTQEVISTAPITLTVADSSFMDKNYNYFVFDTTKASGTTIKLQSYKYGDTTEWDGLTDWGDGTIDTSTSHTYSSNGIYTVKTKCSFNSENSAFGSLLADSNTRDMLIEVLSVNRKIKYVQYMFSSCHNVVSINVSNLNTSIITNMDSMFNSCSKLETLNLSNWNMDNVTNTTDMFIYCDSLHIANVKMDNCSESTVAKLTQLIPT